MRSSVGRACGPLRGSFSVGRALTKRSFHSLQKRTPNSCYAKKPNSHLPLFAVTPLQTLPKRYFNVPWKNKEQREQRPTGDEEIDWNELGFKHEGTPIDYINEFFENHNYFLESPVHSLAMEGLSMMHNAGLPWGGAIVALAVSSRMLMSVMRMIIFKKHTTAYSSEYMGLLMDLENAKNPDETQKISKKVESHQEAHPISTPQRLNFLATATGLAFATTFPVAIWGLALCHPEFATEGALWAPSLSSTETDLALSALTAGSFYLAYRQIGARASPFGFLLLTSVILLGTPTVPAAVHLYFISGNCTSALATMMMRMNTIRGCLGIPSIQEVAHAEHMKQQLFSLKDNKMRGAANAE